MKNNFDDLKNKVCVITGGTGVLGASMAGALLNAGVRVAIIGTQDEKSTRVANELQEKHGGEIIGIGANVMDKASLENAHKKIVRELGSVDLLVNAAGGNSPKATAQCEVMEDDSKGSFFDLDIEGFEHVFGINFKGTVTSSMVFAKDMIAKKKGVILNISSMSAFHPLTKVAGYSAAKAAVNNFTEWLSVHLAKQGVRVNAMAPGFFLTDQNRFLLTDEATGELTARGNKIVSNTPMGRFGEPEELNGTVLYLLSDLSRFVTGVVLPVDGGFNAFSGV